MTVAQIDHTSTFTDRLPAQSTLARLEELFHQRRGALITANNRRIRLQAFDEKYAETDWQMSDGRIRLANELTQAEMRCREIEGEIINVARLIVVEADNGEELEERNTE